MTKRPINDQKSLEETDEIYDYVGSQMRANRIGRGLTQAQIAKVIGISPQQYQKYEDARSKCSLNSIKILAGYYGVPLTTFLPEEASTSIVINEADLLARLVTAYSLFSNVDKKLRFVQLAEAVTKEDS
jgi:transcriptional regulator with XRE-family HTH domain